MQKARREARRPTEGDDIGALLKVVAMALISSVGGAAGPLYGTLFLQMGDGDGRHAASSTLDGWTAALEAGVKGVLARGKAEPGDKTMLDALLPGGRSAQDGARRRRGARRRAAAAAEPPPRACVETIPLEARKGRASYLGPRSVGPPGPGCDVVAPAHRVGSVRLCRRDTGGREKGRLGRLVERRKQLSIFGAEVIGTALLILLGDGVVAAVLLSHSKAQNSGWIVISFGWGMAVMVGVFAVGQFSGAHLNPAVTVGFAVAGHHRVE